MTRNLKIDASEPQTHVLAEAAALLQKGGLVALPTETLYGLAADIAHHQALKRLAAAKRRPQAKPFSLILAAIEQLDQVVAQIPDIANELIAQFWPGPLTLVLPARPGLDPLITAGRKTVAVRVSSHPVAAGLAQALGRPITASSANISGQAPPSRAEEISSDLKLFLDLILDGGPCAGGLASTMVAFDHEGKPRLLRPGAVSLPKLQSPE